MTTCNDLHHNQPVPGSLEVRIYRIDTDPAPPREVELYATDTEQNDLKIVIWEKHSISGDWHPGDDYKITGGRVQRYDDVSGPEVRIHSNDEFTIERLDNISTPTRLLVVGDTHIGYRHRDRSEKPTWARSVDAHKGFNQALDIAQEHSVDAILHAGDVFDHKATDSDCVTVTEALVDPLKADIPLYYIRGNHDTEYGIESLQMFAEGAEMRLRLSADPITLDDPNVNLFGIDYTAGNLTNIDSDSFVSAATDRNILVLHEKPYPLVDKQGTLTYDDGANVSNLLDSVSANIDLIVTGHMHVGTRGRIPGHDIPVIVTGPTARISQYKKDNRPSVWLVTVSEHDLSIDRIKLSS